MQSLKKRWFFFIMVLLFACFSGMADSRPFADESVGGHEMTWFPNVQYGSLALNVSCPNGVVFSKTFKPGVTPYFSLSMLGNKGIPDGSYTYELRFNPVVEKRGLRPEGSPQGEIQDRNKTYPQPLIQTGSFQVQAGAILPKTLGSEDLARPTDILHYDDVIITGSQCVGYDCVDGETFNYDTIRLKENNVQIHFDDTSSTAGFPANDWRIIANDSGSGGANYLAVEDSTAAKKIFVLRAGARENAFYLDSAGRVGLGTSTPIYNLHMQYGDSPAIRLHQDTSYGWTEQKWDISGNEANFFVRDGTNGSKLPFRIQPSAPTNSIYIENTGDIGMGTSTPGYAVDVQRTGANAALVVTRTDGASNYVNATDAYANFGSVNDFPTRVMVNGAWRMRLNNDNSLTMASNATCTAGGTWTNSSSITLKENIQALSTQEAVETLKNLNPVKYNYKVDKEERHVGFIAEDVPDLVASKDRKGMSPMDVTAVLTQVVKEQQKTIEELKQRIADLEKK